MNLFAFDCQEKGKKMKIKQGFTGRAEYSKNALNNSIKFKRKYVNLKM